MNVLSFLFLLLGLQCLVNKNFNVVINVSFQHFLPEKSGSTRTQRHGPTGAASLALLTLNPVLWDVFWGGFQADSVKPCLRVFVRT